MEVPINYKKWHRKLAWFILIPATLIFASGVLLHLRRIFPVIQPKIQQGVALVDPKIQINEVIDLIQKNKKIDSIPILMDRSQIWNELKSIEYKPQNGIWLVRTKDYMEFQIDGQSGKILSESLRPSLWIIQIHEGIYFGSLVLWLIFFPTGIALLVMNFTGAHLLFKSFKNNRTKKI